MICVGIDLHKRRSHIAALDERGGRILSRRIQNDPASFLELLSEIDGESKVALEATYGWEWLADLSCASRVMRSRRKLERDARVS